MGTFVIFFFWIFIPHYVVCEFFFPLFFTFLIRGVRPPELLLFLFPIHFSPRVPF